MLGSERIASVHVEFHSDSDRNHSPPPYACHTHNAVLNPFRVS